MRGDDVVAERVQDVGPVEQPLDLLRREAVRDVGVLEDVVERPAAVVLADHDARRTSSSFATRS